jgi:hypothetical protein
MDLHRYEPLMRSLTLELPEIGDAVKKVDVARYNFLASIFSELGFRDEELDLRVRMFMTVISQEGNLLLDRPQGKWVAQLEKRLDFLIRPGPKDGVPRQPGKRRATFFPESGSSRLSSRASPGLS